MVSNLLQQIVVPNVTVVLRIRKKFNLLSALKLQKGMGKWVIKMRKWPVLFKRYTIYPV
jgi:hypothetical protein